MMLQPNSTNPTLAVWSLTLNCPAANASDEEAAKEEGRFSNGGSQPGYSAKAEKQKAQSRALWWNTSADQPVPQQHVPEWLVLW